MTDRAAYSISIFGSALCLLLGYQGVSAQTLVRSELRFSAGTEAQTVSSENHLRIAAVGDILLHRPLHVQALRQKDGHESLWSELSERLKLADMTYGNLEGPVAPGVSGSGKLVRDPGLQFDDFVYTSYPRFNYHEHLVKDLVESGFDIVSTANNHSLDRGSFGVDRTIEVLNKYELQFTGSRTRTAQENEREQGYALVERKGFHIAWIACTFSTNGIPDTYHQILDCYKDHLFIRRVVQNLAADPTVDAVIVTPHTGIEYQDVPEKRAIKLYRSYIDAGALAVIGAHPHVLQPWEKYTTSEGREGFIVYSLGNFVSGQFHKVKTRATILLYLDLIKDPRGKAQISEVKYIPLEMVRAAGAYQVIPIRDDRGTPFILRHIISMFGNENLIIDR